LFGKHTPEALHVSGSVQTFCEESPQAVPSALFVCVHVPPEQMSFVQSLPSEVQLTPLARTLVWQAPDPLQVSAPSQSEEAELPHAAPAALFGCVHVPPEQTSLVQSFVSAVQADPLAWLFVRQVP
jgi:hypothetical protein